MGQIAPKEEPEPKRLKPNENAQQQQTLNKFFKPTKEAVETVTIGYDTNRNRGEKGMCDGCGRVHPTHEQKQIAMDATSFVKSTLTSIMRKSLGKTLLLAKLMQNQEPMV